MTALPSPAFRLTLLSAFTALLVVVSGCSGSSQTPPPTSPLANTCPATTGSGTTHSSDINSNTTWTAATSPHKPTSSFRINSGATLTLEPCTVVQLPAGATLTVRGTLVAAGQPGKPVVIDSTGPGVRWGYISTWPPTSTPPITTFVDLAYTLLLNGGLTDINGLATVNLEGNYSDDPRQAIMRVNNVLIDGAAGDYGYGLFIGSGATLTDDSTALTIKNALSYPIRVGDKLIGSIPPGTYTGNGIDQILWQSVADIDEDTVIHDRGIPYRLGATNGDGADMRVGLGSTGAPLVTLAVEAGVKVLVHPNGRLLMSASLNAAVGTGYHISGSLIALGTAAKPIVFTSANAVPAPGDWPGLRFDEVPAANSRLDHVRVEYAGGPSYANSYHCDPATGSYSSSEDSAILMFGQPPSSFVTNSTIAYSAGDGFGRAYTGTPIDFMATNSFIAVAGCKQGYPRAPTPPGPMCPNPVPCPK
jgi:hypothetical protein